MSHYFFKTWHTAITAEAAAEPRDQWLFAMEDDECSTVTIRKVSTKNGRASRSQPGDLRRYSAPSQSATDSASYLRSLKKSPIRY